MAPCFGLNIFAKALLIWFLTAEHLQLASAERPPAEAEDSEETFPRLSSRLADISRSGRFAQAEEPESDPSEDVVSAAPLESLEVHASRHSFGFKRRLTHGLHGNAESLQNREGALQRQLQLAREERGEAESLQASEERKAMALKEELEDTANEEEHAYELLREARRELAAKSKEVASTHASLSSYAGLADDLRDAASEAAKQVSDAKQEAAVAKARVADESKRARRNLEAAKAAAAEADHATDEVARTRREMQLREAAAADEIARAAKLKKQFEAKYLEAQRAEQAAEHKRRKVMLEEKQMAAQGLAAVQREHLKAVEAWRHVKAAEEQRQEHFQAAHNMLKQTSQAEAVLEEAALEKAAARKEKERAIWVKQQAYRNWQDANWFSRISWGLLALVLIGVLGFSTEAQRMQIAGLRPLKLLIPFRGCVPTQRKRTDLPAEAVTEDDITPAASEESVEVLASATPTAASGIADADIIMQPVPPEMAALSPPMFPDVATASLVHLSDTAAGSSPRLTTPDTVSLAAVDYGY
jgi:hypothetical protein